MSYSTTATPLSLAPVDDVTVPVTGAGFAPLPLASWLPPSVCLSSAALAFDWSARWANVAASTTVNTVAARSSPSSVMRRRLKRGRWTMATIVVAPPGGGPPGASGSIGTPPGGWAATPTVSSRTIGVPNHGRLPLTSPRVTPTAFGSTLTIGGTKNVVVTSSGSAAATTASTGVLP